jgi:hypothetical protein
MLKILSKGLSGMDVDDLSIPTILTHLSTVVQNPKLPLSTGQYEIRHKLFKDSDSVGIVPELTDGYSVCKPLRELRDNSTHREHSIRKL